MAISPTLKGVKVFIKVDGVVAKEYEDVGDNTNYAYPEKTVVKYIESVSNANYAIVSQVDPTYKQKSSLAFYIQVDETVLPSSNLFSAKEKIDKPWVSTVDGLEQVDLLGRTSKKMFKFEELQFGIISFSALAMVVKHMNANEGLVEDDDKERIKNDARDAAHIGELQIAVFKVQILGCAGTQLVHIQGKRETKLLEIAEKAVKGRTLSHGTS